MPRRGGEQNHVTDLSTQAPAKAGAGVEGPKDNESEQNFWHSTCSVPDSQHVAQVFSRSADIRLTKARQIIDTGNSGKESNKQDGTGSFAG
jgi:hypothetical protein